MTDLITCPLISNQLQLVSEIWLEQEERNLGSKSQPKNTTIGEVKLVQGYEEGLTPDGAYFPFRLWNLRIIFVQVNSPFE